MKLWLTYDEASTLFGLSKRTLRKLVKEGKIKAGPPERIGKKGVRLSLESLVNYFENGSTRKRGRPRKGLPIPGLPG